MSVHSPKGVDMNVNEDDPNTWSKSKKKRMRKKRKMMGEATSKEDGGGGGGAGQNTNTDDSCSSNASNQHAAGNQHKRQKVSAAETLLNKQSHDAHMNTDATTGMVGVSPIKSPKKKKKKKKKKLNQSNAMDASPMQAEKLVSTSANQPKSEQSSSTEQKQPHIKPKPVLMSTLQKSFLARLTSSRFRELNEELYTKPSSESFAQFTSNPELFEQYHQGFRKQAEQWPVNPVDVICKKIVSAYKKQHTKDKAVVVADFGCGDAKLAERLLKLQLDENGNLSTKPSGKKKKKKVKGGICPFKVHSFDLVSGDNPLVTPADIMNVPLDAMSVDVGVYCLALMGTNVPDFVREAWRVLKFGGILKIAEVRSRFEASADGGGKKIHSRKSDRADDVDIPKPLMILDDFKSLMERCGFRCTDTDQSNKMFLFMDFVKVEGSIGLSEKENFSAKPCIYKRR